MLTTVKFDELEKPVHEPRLKAVTEKWLVSEREAADLAGFSVVALVKWRREGGGPRHIRFGRSIRYRVSDLLSWIDDHAVGQLSS